MSSIQRGKWTGISDAYQRSFAQLCAGTANAVLDAVSDTGTELLDVGCGTGELAQRAHERGWVVTAVDPERDMVARAAKTLHELDVRVIEGSLPDSQQQVRTGPPDPGCRTTSISSVLSRGWLPWRRQLDSFQ